MRLEKSVSVSEHQIRSNEMKPGQRVTEDQTGMEAQKNGLNTEKTMKWII